MPSLRWTHDKSRAGCKSCRQGPPYQQVDRSHHQHRAQVHCRGVARGRQGGTARLREFSDAEPQSQNRRGGAGSFKEGAVLQGREGPPGGGNAVVTHRLCIARRHPTQDMAEAVSGGPLPAISTTAPRHCQGRRFPVWGTGRKRRFVQQRRQPKVYIRGFYRKFRPGNLRAVVRFSIPLKASPDTPIPGASGMPSMRLP